MTNISPPAELAAALTAFVDILIPGDGDFPAAASVGTQGMLADRIRQRLGNAAFARIAAILNHDGPFSQLALARRVELVSEFERTDPELFAFLRFATYFAYYETPAVIATLQALGHDYHDSPQPLGYNLPPFDPAKHLPAKPRGHYKQSGAIVRLDLSALADLDLPVREEPR